MTPQALIYLAQLTVALSIDAVMLAVTVAYEIRFCLQRKSVEREDRL